MRYDERGIFVGDDMLNGDDLSHYGTPRHSGRYPWGSGENPYQRNIDFLGRIEKMRAEKDSNGKRLFSEVDIAKSMGMTTTEYRKQISVARGEIFSYEKALVDRLRAKGMSRPAIEKRTGVPEATQRSWEKEQVQATLSRNANAAKLLRDRVADVKYVQVGAGAEYYLGNLSSTSLNNTLKILEKEGYTLHDVKVEQLGTGKMTTVKVLAGPGVETREIKKNLDQVKLPIDIYEEDGEVKSAKPFVSVDSKRVDVRYAEDGGLDRDGMIEVRRGVKDLDLGRNHYVQGRILIDGTHYAKGMVTYADDLPPGVDIRINSNKKRGTPLISDEPGGKEVLKPIKADQENIFGANIKPDEKLIRAHRTYLDDDGTEKQSAINIVKEEGDVDAWTKSLASQFLSKQPPELARQQLKTTLDIAKSEFEEIAAYTNPVVKQKMLEDFAGRVDHDAVHLAAAALPRQKTKFLMPLTNVKDNECYCPGFEDGEQVALVRFPHASISEIPILTVNNANKKAKEVLGDAIDAVGINSKSAERLSGADFDGDTVLVIPTKNVKIANKSQFPELKDFDDKAAYPGYEGMTKMTKHQHGIEMGKVSNLITDMTIKGADDHEIARALKHSMVVVDAEKHGLDWKRSEVENGIQALKDKYQNGGSVSTLLSRSGHDDEIPERELKRPSRMSEDELARWKAGEEIYRDTGRTKARASYPTKDMTPEELAAWNSKDKAKQNEVKKAMRESGRAVYTYKGATEKVARGYLKDPDELTSTGNRKTAEPIERVYANHAEAMKNLAKEARAMARSLEMPKADPEARKKYEREVASLKMKVSEAKKNAPLERLAQIKANKRYWQWRWDHPEEDAEHQKREKGRLLDWARKSVGAKKAIIGGDNNNPDKNPLTAKEWEAIQAKAVSPSLLREIMDNADMETVRKYAMPKTKNGLDSAKKSRAKRMLSNGYTRAEVCDMLDISESTLIDAIGLANI